LTAFIIDLEYEQLSLFYLNCKIIDHYLSNCRWLQQDTNVIYGEEKVVDAQTVMLRHAIWNTLPAPEADTDAEAEQTPARRGVRSLLMDETRPSIWTLHQIRLHLFGYHIRYVIWEKISRIPNFRVKISRVEHFHVYSRLRYLLYIIYVSKRLYF